MMMIVMFVDYFIDHNCLVSLSDFDGNWCSPGHTRSVGLWG